jgi:hypothetical protein
VMPAPRTSATRLAWNLKVLGVSLWRCGGVFGRLGREDSSLFVDDNQGKQFSLKCEWNGVRYSGSVSLQGGICTGEVPLPYQETFIFGALCFQVKMLDLSSGVRP